MAHPRTPGLDLLRAAAVLAVVAYHGAAEFLPLAGLPVPVSLAPVGGIAVEVFYALSGYLIGRILLDLVGRPTLAGWLHFMGRRWTRTLPLYAVVLAVSVCLARPDASEIIRFATMTQNLVAPMPASSLGGLMGVSWSLTVEEAFYLLFAASLLVAARGFGRRAVWQVIITFLVVPPVLRMLTYGMPQAYMVACLNLDGIAWGVCLAQLERQGHPVFRHPVTAFFAGLGLLAASWAPYALGWRSLGGEWHPLSLTVASIGAALVVSAALKVGGLGRFGRLVRMVSAHSYGTYLLHWLSLTVAVSLVSDGVVGVATGLVGFLAATVTLAWASLKWIETPGMKIRLPAVRVRRVALASA